MCVCSKGKKVIFGEHLAHIYQLFTTCTLPLIVIHLCNSINCRTFAFPKFN